MDRGLRGDLGTAVMARDIASGSCASPVSASIGACACSSAGWGCCLRLASTTASSSGVRILRDANLLGVDVPLLLGLVLRRVPGARLRLHLGGPGTALRSAKK